jgi:DNA-binding MarR family transcriptional regulator
MRRPAPRKIDYTALAEFRYEIRRYLNFAKRAARGTGIEPQQYQSLLAIKGLPQREKSTVGALAEQMQVAHQSAVELSGRLEQNGWIRRERSHADRREVLLRLTSRGERLLAKLSLSHRNELRTAEPKLIRALQMAVARRRRS